MICSIRSEMSVCPLRPAAAARSCRRPPRRWASSAERVTSEMVLPRRLASCRKRSSSSSGIFTVVRTMVCQHTVLNAPAVSAAPACGLPLRSGRGPPAPTEQSVTLSAIARRFLGVPPTAGSSREQRLRYVRRCAVFPLPSLGLVWGIVLAVGHDAMWLLIVMGAGTVGSLVNIASLSWRIRRASSKSSGGSTAPS